MKVIIRSLLAVLLVAPAILVNAERDVEETSSGPVDVTDDQATVALLKKMDEDRVQAGVRKDVGAIAAVTADDYLQIDLNGTVRDKTAALLRIKANDIQLQSNVLDDMVVRIYGNTAVLTARSTPKGTIDGKDFGPARYSRVYVKRHGRWQVVMFQMTRIAEGIT